MSETYSLQPRRSPGCFSRLLGALLFLVFAVLIVMPSSGRAREPAKRVKCSNNLRQIALAIRMYADGNGGQLPPDLGTVLRTQEITADVFICRSADDTSAMGTVEEQAANHDHKPRDGGATFVFADSSARYIPHAQPVIDQLRAGQNPPTLPGVAGGATGGR